MTEKPKDHCVVTIALSRQSDIDDLDPKVFVHTYGPYTKAESSRMCNQLRRRYAGEVVCYARKLISGTEVDSTPYTAKGGVLGLRLSRKGA